MKIIISPAKNMREEQVLPPQGEPVFLAQAKRLAVFLAGLPYDRLKELLACNDRIAQLNYRRYQAMDLQRGQSPALLSYEGIQYRYMAPGVFTDSQFHYIQQHLRIVSGLYGLLRPFDGVVPHRLEMQARLHTDFCRDLYDFWGGSLARQLICDGDDTVLDLASAEYSRAVLPHLPPGVRRVRPVFGQWEQGKIVEKGVYVKMARGEMVRFLAETQAGQPEQMERFSALGYQYQRDLSRPDRPVFLKEGSGYGEKQAVE